MTGGAGTFDENVVSADDVLVAHGVAADFECEDIFIAHDVVQRDTLGVLDSLDRQTGGDAAHKGQALAGAGSGTDGYDIDRAAAVVDTVEQTLLFEIGDVLVDGGQGLQVESARDLFKRRRVAVAGDERLQKIENFFLSSCDCHARILANEKRNSQYYFRSPFS